MVSIPACHAGDRGSIPRLGDYCFYILIAYFVIILFDMCIQNAIAVTVNFLSVVYARTPMIGTSHSDDQQQ